MVVEEAVLEVARLDVEVLVRIIVVGIVLTHVEEDATVIAKVLVPVLVVAIAPEHVRPVVLVPPHRCELYND